MSFLVQSFTRFVAKHYQASVAASLAEYGTIICVVHFYWLISCSWSGLKYQDILVETNDVKVALSRADPKLIEERQVQFH